jgi:hypothetical protein
MNPSTVDSNADCPDWESFSLTGILLSPTQIQRAAQLSQSVGTVDRQWQVYVNVLALFGVEQWFAERSPDLPVSLQHCAILQPQSAAFIESVCHLQVGKFTVGVVAIDSFPDEIVSLPQAVVEQPEFIDHFYILTEVLEEQGQIQICGYLRHDEWIDYQRSNSLLTRSDKNYLVPIHYFRRDPDTLLLELRCLDPSAVPLPKSEDLFFNVRLWFQDQLDQLAQGLSWTLLPIFAEPVYALRSVEEFDQIATQLKQEGVTIPEQARVAYRDWDEIGVRLYAAVWELPAQPSEWALFILVGAQPGRSLSQGTQLEIRDAAQLLVKQVLREKSSESYLYAQVEGSVDERFWVTFAMNGMTHTLPPFGVQ